MKKLSELWVLALVVVVSAFLIPSSAFAATYYVDFTSGTNSANCTSSSSPCKTFAAAGLSGVTAGDVINTTGTYDSGVGTDIDITWSGTSGNPITIQQWEGETQPVLDGSSGFTNYTLRLSGDYTIIDSFEIIGPEGDDDMACYINSSAGSVLQDSTIHAAASEHSSNFGIFALSSTDLQILNNEIYDAPLNRINNDSGTVVVANNKFYDEADSVSVALNLLNVTGPQVYNNFFYNNGTNIFLGNSKAPPPDTSVVDPVIVNNSFYNGGIAIYAIGDPGSGNLLKNNIFHTDSLVAIGDYSGSDDYLDNVVSDNNIFYGTTLVAKGTSDYATLAEWRAYAGQDVNSAEEDPLYVSTTAGSEDLHLQATSPAIDAGTDESAYLTDDMNGEPRPYNVIFDIGADERAVPQAATSPTASSIGADTAEVSWTAPTTGTTSYTLQYGTVENFNGAETVSGITDTSYSISGLSAGTLYYFRVMAVYTTSYTTYESAYTSTASFITAPSLPSVSGIGAKKATFTWDGNADSYSIEVSKNLDFSGATSVDSLTSTSTTVSGLDTSRKYYARVKAASSGSESDWSATASFRTLPAKGQINKIVKINDTTVSLRCKKIARIQEMKAKIWLKKGGKWKKLKVVTKKKKLKKSPVKIKVSNLKQGKKYRAVVWGKYKAKVGAQSPKKRFHL